MSQKIIPVAYSQLTSLDLEAFVSQAKALNQRNQERFTTSFPKHDSRWISHYQFQPRPITFTDKGAVEGSLSWLVAIRQNIVSKRLAESWTAHRVDFGSDYRQLIVVDIKECNENKYWESDLAFDNTLEVNLRNYAWQESCLFYSLVSTTIVQKRKFSFRQQIV